MAPCPHPYNCPWKHKYTYSSWFVGFALEAERGGGQSLKVKTCQYWWGACMLPYFRLWIKPLRSVTHGQCNSRPIYRPTVTFPAAGHRWPSTGHQIILLSDTDRGTWVWITCPRSLQGLHGRESNSIPPEWQANALSKILYTANRHQAHLNRIISSNTKTRIIWKMLGPFATASRRTPPVLILHCHSPGVATVACRLRVHVHNNNNDNNDNAWQKGPLWPYRMGTIIQYV